MEKKPRQPKPELPKFCMLCGQQFESLVEHVKSAHPQYYQPRPNKKKEAGK